MIQDPTFFNSLKNDRNAYQLFLTYDSFSSFRPTNPTEEYNTIFTFKDNNIINFSRDVTRRLLLILLKRYETILQKPWTF